jgi:hypothetical protein
LVVVVTSVSISEEEDDVSEEGEEGITKPEPSFSISSLSGRRERTRGCLASGQWASV